MSHENQFSHNVRRPRDGGKDTGKAKANPTTTYDVSTPGPSQTIAVGLDDPNLTIVKDLDTIIEQFRSKQVTKMRAIALITSKLDFNLSEVEPGKDAALNQCISTLNAIEQITVERVTLCR